jgi:hypothetical protein
MTLLTRLEVQMAEVLFWSCNMGWQPGIAALLYMVHLNNMDVSDFMSFDSENPPAAFCDNPNNYIFDHTTPLGTYGLDGSEVPFGMER